MQNTSITQLTPVQQLNLQLNTWTKNLFTPAPSKRRREEKEKGEEEHTIEYNSSWNQTKLLPGLFISMINTPLRVILGASFN